MLRWLRLCDEKKDLNQQNGRADMGEVRIGSGRRQREKRGAGPGKDQGRGGNDRQIRRPLGAWRQPGRHLLGTFRQARGEGGGPGQAVTAAIFV
jgi:hypothetical protein